MKIAIIFVLLLVQDGLSLLQNLNTRIRGFAALSRSNLKATKQVTHVPVAENASVGKKAKKAAGTAASTFQPPLLNSHGRALPSFPTKLPPLGQTFSATAPTI